MAGSKQPQTSFIGVGLALGVALGSGIGLLIGSLIIGIGVGLALGVALGAALDAGQKKKAARREGGDAPMIFADGGGRSKDHDGPDGDGGSDGGGDGGGD